ncbi:hypothetical protein N7478_001795 [Penicillium angulare]|uniref:uncharacterized protein n=1 Tax=Penicillium angulare TaxID=116970 RepID=UPI00254139D3|nr:uncharacterized protein N7478_001795 [Penicillium angulare]KAJ5288765.1 hypothetical protein N7478_001795 [Penicillium angulare]
MKLSTLIYFLTASAVAADPQPEKRDATSVSPTATATTTGGFNLASLENAMFVLSSSINIKNEEMLTLSRINLANQTATGNFGNISPPPKTLLGEILSVVPMSVVGELMDANSRSALASELSAGNTPAWYSSLPADVKSYMAIVRSQISGGALTATTGLAYQTTSTTASGVSATGTANTATGGTSTSSGMAVAAQPTVFAGSMIGALGVLGLALAL